MVLNESRPRSIDEFVDPLIQLHILAPEKAVEDYALAAKEILTINEQLEPLEKIEKFAIINSNFSIRFHKTVGSGKLRRSRVSFRIRFESEIDYLYSAEFDSPFFREITKKTKTAA